MRMADCRCDPWNSLIRHVSYVGERLRLDTNLLRRLVEEGILTRNDYEQLTNESTPQSRRIDRLLLHILPTKDPKLFDTFCRILKAVGQGFLAQRLEEKSLHNDESPSHDQIEGTVITTSLPVNKLITRG